LEAVLSVSFVSRLYKEDQLPLRQSLDMAVRRLGVWCEIAVSLRGREPGSRGNLLLEEVTKQRSEDRD
jgi:hypothetical protein